MVEEVPRYEAQGPIVPSQDTPAPPAAVRPAQHHWENVYQNKADNEVSWYEQSPDLSVSLLRAAGVGLDATVVDIGGGASALVDTLMRAGQAHVTVLDLSAAALERARQRLSVVSGVIGWFPTSATGSPIVFLTPRMTGQHSIFSRRPRTRRPILPY